MRLGRSNFWEGEVKNFIATNDTVKNEMLCLLGVEVSLMVKQIIYILSVEISISNVRCSCTLVYNSGVSQTIFINQA